ncbi:MAG: hypothetical protein LC637_04095 [Xanthomonadaceae bacterium]|nr:hypothetical protein [Xanthomonadaceae bacterium]
MAKQTVTLRLEQEDLDYLSAVDIQGAGNFSEKIRALLAEARAQREGVNDPAAAPGRFGPAIIASRFSRLLRPDRFGPTSRQRSRIRA